MMPGVDMDVAGKDRIARVKGRALENLSWKECPN